MSLYGMAMYSDDRWLVCHWGSPVQPLYHDCENCEYTTVCEYGKLYLADKQLELETERSKRIIREANRIIDEINSRYDPRVFRVDHISLT